MKTEKGLIYTSLTSLVGQKFKANNVLKQTKVIVLIFNNEF